MDWFERILWSSRYVVLVPVVACILVSLLLFGIVTIEVAQLPGHLGAFVDSTLDEGARARLYSDGIASIAKVIDGYLFATIMLIFAMGLYELFIGKIEVAEGNPVAERVLLIRSFDDLKDRLAKVVFLILIVTYFEYALRGSYDTSRDLLSLAAGIALIAGAIWLTGRHRPARWWRPLDGLGVTEDDADHPQGGTLRRLFQRHFACVATCGVCSRRPACVGRCRTRRRRAR